MRALALLGLAALLAGCCVPRPSRPSASSATGRGSIVAAPDNAAPITPGAISYPTGRTYRITKLDSNTMAPSQTWTARGETIFETRDSVTFRDESTGAPVEVRGTYRLKRLP